MSLPSIPAIYPNMRLEVTGIAMIREFPIADTLKRKRDEEEVSVQVKRAKNIEGIAVKPIHEAKKEEISSVSSLAHRREETRFTDLKQSEFKTPEIDRILKKLKLDPPIKRTATPIMEDPRLLFRRAYPDLFKICDVCRASHLFLDNQVACTTDMALLKYRCRICNVVHRTSDKMQHECVRKIVVQKKLIGTLCTKHHKLVWLNPIHTVTGNGLQCPKCLHAKAIKKLNKELGKELSKVKDK